MSGIDWDWFFSLTYVWIKAAHVIFVIFFSAGLFLLPRYYIYHQEAEPGSEEEHRWIDRERKLRSIILTPSMILLWIFGLTLALTIAFILDGCVSDSVIQVWRRGRSDR